MSIQNTIYSKTVSLGKVDGYGSGRKSCELTVTCTLTRHNRDVFNETPWRTVDLKDIWSYVEVSITADVWNHLKTDIIAGGQMKDDILRYVDTPWTRDLVVLWDRVHLNGTKAGTTKQERVINSMPDLSTHENRMDVALKLFSMPDNAYTVKPAERADPRQAINRYQEEKVKQANDLLDKEESARRSVLRKLWQDVIPIMHTLRDEDKTFDRHDYTLRQLWLLSSGLLWDRGYCYGHGWLVDPLGGIPAHEGEAIEELKDFFNQVDQPPAVANWTDAVKLESAIRVESKDKRFNWRVTLSYQGRNGVFSFQCGRADLRPTALDMIGCFHNDMTTPDDPDELVSELGYDYKEARKLAHALKVERRKLQTLFGSDFDKLITDQDDQPEN